MDALDLVALGRRLMKIGEDALRTREPAGSRNALLTVGASLVLRDVFNHPDSSIREITIRTGLPQSYVSESVARLRDQGMVTTAVDPADRRRTLARFTPQHARTVLQKGAVTVDEELARSLGEPDAAAIKEIIEGLSQLAARLLTRKLNPVEGQLRLPPPNPGLTGEDTI
jgi:DNA-binding MarR family transcriptional regulator